MTDPNTLFSLHEEGKAWVLEKGTVNVFAIKKIDGDRGPRQRLITVSAPAVLFSWDSNKTDSFEIVAITEEECALREVDPSSLETKALQSSLERWLLSFADFFTKESGKELSVYLPGKGEIDIPKGAFFESREKIEWLHLVEGKIQLFDYFDPASIHKASTYPLIHKVWMCASEASKIEILDTALAIQKGFWKKGLQEFHRLLSLYIHFQMHQKEREELTRLQKRREKETESLSVIFSEMSSLLNPDEKIAGFSPHPLFQACQVIGTLLHVEFVLHKETEKTQLKGIELREFALNEICQASELRFRKIFLSGEWWKEESGPFLAFYKKVQKPVVLVFESSSHFAMIDPNTGERNKVNAKIAADIFPFSYFFYRPFPDELVSGKEVIQWYLKQHAKDLIPLFIYGLAGAVLALFPPIAAAILFHRVIPNAENGLLLQVSGGLVLAAIGSALFFFFRSLILVRIQGLAGHEILTAFWDRLFKLPSKFFHRFSSGNLYSRLYSLEEIRTLLSASGARAILSGIFSFFYFLMMAFYSLKLTLIPLFLALVSGSITWVASRNKIRIQKESLNLKGQLNGILIQIVSGIAKLRMAGAESGAFSHWASSFTKNEKWEMDIQWFQNVVIVSNAILSFFGITLLFALTIYIQTEGAVPVWVFFAFNAAFLPFIFSLFDLSNTVIEMVSAVPLWQRAKTILEEPLEITKSKESPGQLKGEIAIDQVCFQYEPSAPPILNGISIAVRPKEFIAIVGPSGSGKSTLLKLLLGFERPVSGAIFFDGKELNRLNPREVRKQLGAVLQDTGLIAGTIYDNITCGGLYSKEQIENALQLSGFQEELESFPMGLHTVVTVGAPTFSGGQKQRLLIARALVSQPRILIFDEATSFLDNKTQDEVSRNIEQLEISRIVVAHRLSTIRNADRIYVLDQGRIVQSGTFEELSHQEGLFRAMMKRQAL